MPLPSLRRALCGAGLMLCVCAPFARAQQNAPATDTASNASPIPVPVAEGTVVPANAQMAPVQTTPVQLKAPTLEERRQKTEEKLRVLMQNLGITSATTQDSIIIYLAEDEMGRAGARDAEQRLLTGLRRDVPPERMRDLLGDYRAAIESEKTNRVQAQRKLDARVGYSLDPKLEAMLWLMGVLGDSASKLPTSALVARQTETPPDETKPKAPVYGPPISPNFGARGEIVGTVMAKGIAETGEHWLEIRDDSGALDRYAALWREDLGALDPEVDKQLSATPLSARVRVQWVWQERRRALSLRPETPSQTVTKNPAP